MNIIFEWGEYPRREPDIQVNTEVEVSAIIKDHDIKPCHSDAIIVSLGIGGQLNTDLRGSAKCECGKTLMEFEGFQSTISKFTL